MFWKSCVLLTCLLRLTCCEIVAPPTVPDWWRNAVVYEVFPLSFRDSDGDGSGDFRGITEKLDYIAEIGVTAIWLTPFMKSPLKSAGYDVSDYLEVQSVFGTKEDFIELLNAAHKRNLKVIMDFVPNHTSDQHKWFQESIRNATGEYADYYIWKDAKNKEEMLKDPTVKPVEPNNWKRICPTGDENSAWVWNDIRKQFYFTQFVPNIPDLNFRNPKVLDEMKNVLNYWIGLGIDGIRIDALKHVYETVELKDEPVIDPSKPVDYLNLDHIYTTDLDEIYDLLREWRHLLDGFKEKDDSTKIMITESYSSEEVLFKYYRVGVEIPSNFHLLKWDYTTPEELNKILKSWIVNMPKGATFNLVLQNHDYTRFTTSYSVTLTDCMNSLSLFLPGIAVVYYGGEIGMEDYPGETDIIHRTPMQWDNSTHAGFSDDGAKDPWNEIHPNYVECNVQTEREDPKSYLNFFKSVSHLRQTETMQRGGLATFVFNETVFVLNRFLPGYENYTLVMNMHRTDTQRVRLSEQIPDLNKYLTVVLSSRYSTLVAGEAVSTELLTLTPGTVIIFTDRPRTAAAEPTQSLGTTTTVTSTEIPRTTVAAHHCSSSGTESRVTFILLILCSCVAKIFCNP